MAKTLTLYTRAGCPLCEDMADAVQTLLAGSPHGLAQVDVDADATLRSRYGWDVPLVFDGDTELFRHQLNLPVLREWLRAHP